ncbi:MAG: hypothetical protein BWY95_00795 [Bacteroidetes bacterium ADurb.BinA104]|nr:MAG: hypothetical protein BWY95_00795 [Bacteroidetes bacterium ADurb.BinA104]
MGVKIGAPIVVIAFIITESSVLPFENEVIKLDTAPPGHAATSINPIATVADRILCNTAQSRKVKKGRTTH